LGTTVINFPLSVVFKSRLFFSKNLYVVHEQRLDRGITESNVVDSARHLVKILIIIPCRVKHLWIWKLSSLERNFLFSYKI